MKKENYLLDLLYIIGGLLLLGFLLVVCSICGVFSKKKACPDCGSEDFSDDRKRCSDCGYPDYPDCY